MATMDEFIAERETLNALILKDANIEIKRFFSLDTQVYRDGALPARTKEMLGLVSSIVLRCDDCINYHLLKCVEHGVSDSELQEILSVALVVGGSITIPHIRRAVRMWREANEATEGLVLS